MSFRVGTSICRGRVLAGELDEDERIAKGVDDDRHSADRDRGGFRCKTGAGFHEIMYGRVNALDQPVGFHPLSRAQHHFDSAVGKSQTCLPDCVVAPQQLVPEPVAIERESLVQSRHWDRDRIDATKDWRRGHL